MQDDGTVSVRALVASGVGFTRARPRLVAAWIGLACLAQVAFDALMLAVLAPLLFRYAAMMPLAPRGPLVAALFGIQGVCALLAVVALDAVVRAVSRPHEGRFLYLRFGMDELRVVGVCAIVALASFGLMSVALLAILFVGLVVGPLVATGTLIAITIVYCLFFAALVYVHLRLVLALVMTVIRREITIRPAWRATRGHVRTLLGLALIFIGVGVLVQLPYVALYRWSPDMAGVGYGWPPQLPPLGWSTLGLWLAGLPSAVATNLLSVAYFAALTHAALRLDRPRAP